MKRLVSITTELIQGLREAGRLAKEETQKLPHLPNCLLVEDSPEDAELSILALSTLGVSAKVATTGEEAIQLLEESTSQDQPNFDIVFLDLSLIHSRVQGLDVLAYIRAHFPSVHVVLVSGYIDHSVMQVVTHYKGRGGYVGIVRKPLEKLDMMEVFEKHNLPRYR